MHNCESLGGSNIDSLPFLGNISQQLPSPPTSEVSINVPAWEKKTSKTFVNLSIAHRHKRIYGNFFCNSRFLFTLGRSTGLSKLRDDEEWLDVTESTTLNS